MNNDKRHSIDPISKWTKVLQLLSPPNKKRRSTTTDEMKKLYRRGIYIPDPILDEPQNAWQLRELYRITSEKLQTSPVPLYKSVHLKRLLHQLKDKQGLLFKKEEEEDDVPLGTLIEKRQASLILPVLQPLQPCYYSTTNQRFPIQLM
ncbi:hypothetical protein G6F49_005443 [Rhizopus delemar]|nr:hypothetical protein G6F49_005443 [Rhizopus delemar]